MQAYEEETAREKANLNLLKVKKGGWKKQAQNKTI
jgi:hypothetical protein